MNTVVTASRREYVTRQHWRVVLPKRVSPTSTVPHRAAGLGCDIPPAPPPNAVNTFATVALTLFPNKGGVTFLVTQ